LAEILCKVGKDSVESLLIKDKNTIFHRGHYLTALSFPVFPSICPFNKGT